tara:strand:+ start:523 stop:723 length:201 start_codon:yes stop_codon:yes gene_type:complete
MEHINNFIFALIGTIGLILTIFSIFFIVYDDKKNSINKQFYRDALKNKVKLSRKKIKELAHHYSRN